MREGGREGEREGGKGVWNEGGRAMISKECRKGGKQVVCHAGREGRLADREGRQEGRHGIEAGRQAGIQGRQEGKHEEGRAAGLQVR